MTWQRKMGEHHALPEPLRTLARHWRRHGTLDEQVRGYLLPRALDKLGGMDSVMELAIDHLEERDPDLPLSEERVREEAMAVLDAEFERMITKHVDKYLHSDEFEPVVTESGEVHYRRTQSKEGQQ